MQNVPMAYFRIMSRVFIFFALTLFIPNSYFSASELKKNIVEKIHTIPLQDCKILEEFFRKLLFFQGFAFTLFGDKPISVEDFDLEKNQQQLFSTSSKGYKTWKKYVHLFPSRNYLFVFYENRDENLCEITLINKEAFRQTLNKNKEKFAPFLGPKMHSDHLLQLIIKKKSLWNTPLKDRDDLTGILLGYGKHNADLFQKRSEILMPNCPLKKKRTIPSTGYSSLEEELAALNICLKSFSNTGRNSLFFMNLPGFVADPHNEETIQLKKKYTQQRRHITQLYAGGKILEITLEHLCAETLIE